MRAAVQAPTVGVWKAKSKGTKEAEQQANEADTEADSQGESTTSAAEPPMWVMSKLNHQRTRYVFDECFRHKRISRELFDYCCEAQFIDAGLARRWRLPGYEKLCCSACGVPGEAKGAAQLNVQLAFKDTAGRKRKHDEEGSEDKERRVCICRVPARQRKGSHFTKCAVCGCSGCCSGD